MNPPILTADKAGVWSKYLRREGYRDHALVELDAIATGRTVVVEVMTEAQAREAFVEFAGPQPLDMMKVASWLFERAAWLAALRHVGVLK